MSDDVVSQDEGRGVGCITVKGIHYAALGDLVMRVNDDIAGYESQELWEAAGAARWFLEQVSTLLLWQSMSPRRRWWHRVLRRKA